MKPETGEAESYLSSIYTHFEQSDLLCFVRLDMQGDFVSANEAFRSRLHKHYTTEIKGFPFESSLFQEDVPLWHDILSLLLLDDNPLHCIVLRHTHSSGVFRLSWEFSILRDQDESPAGLLAIGFDVRTKPARAANILEETRMIRHILTHVSDGVYILDRSWKILAVNKVFEQVTGRREADLIGRCFWDFFPPDEDRLYTHFLKQAHEENRTVSFEDYYPGVRRWYHSTVYAAPNVLIAYFRDTTITHEAQLKLKRSEERFRAILDSTSHSQFLLDPQMRILSFNRPAREEVERIFHRSLKEGISFRPFLPSRLKDIFEENFKQAILGEVVSSERLMKLPGVDEEVWYQFIYFPVYDRQDLIGVAFNVHNIDAYKKQNLELREIARIESHELRGPLSSLMGLLDLLEENRLDSEMQEVKRKMQTAATNLDKVIYDIVARANRWT